MSEYSARLAQGGNTLPSGEQINLRIDLSDVLYQLNRYRDSEEAAAKIMELEDATDIDRGRALTRMARARLFVGDLAGARDASSSASALLAVSDHHQELAMALRWLGYALFRLGEAEPAREELRDALSAARRANSREDEAATLGAIGMVDIFLGRYRSAYELHERASSIWREVGGRAYEASAQLHSAVASFYLGGWDLCRKALDEAGVAYAEVDNERGATLVQIMRVRLALRKGADSGFDPLAEAQECLRISERIDHARGVVLSLEAVADVEAAAGELEAAEGNLRRALERAVEIAPEGDLVYEVAWRLASVCRRLDRFDEGSELAERCIALAEAARDPRELGNGLVALAEIRRDEGRRFEAVRLVDRAIVVFGELQLPWELAEAHRAAADIKRAADPGIAHESAAHLLNARALRLRLGIPVQVGRESDPDDGEAVVVGQKPVLLAASPSMIHLVEAAKDLSRIEQTVLIEGETGTGKELIAHLIHEAGPREEHPFVAINCAALPQHLLESELFGHKKGSFTGADRDRAGHLVAAGRGTVFLDEIDKATREFQTRLLRVLEDRAAVPVGSSVPAPIQARIVCAANRDLQKLADQGEFLPDLYYRLAGIRLVIPPLRERPEDLQVLVESFLRSSSGVLRSGSYRLSKEAREVIDLYEWPGNVRELRNVLEGAAFFARAEGEIRPEHLGRHILTAIDGDGPRGLPRKIEELERREITAALARTHGNKTQAARILGVTRKGLGDRIRRLELDNS